MIMGIEYRCSYLSLYSETSFDILGGIYRPCVVLIDGEGQRVTFGEVDNRIGGRSDTAPSVRSRVSICTRRKSTVSDNSIVTMRLSLSIAAVPICPSAEIPNICALMRG